MKWRVIDCEIHTAAMNMAIDESIVESVASDGMPVLRFYEWNPQAVSIGHYQKVREALNMRECRAEGADVVRRITGGGAAYHEEGVSFSAIAPSYLFSAYLESCMREASLTLVRALATMNVKVEFEPPDRITEGGKRVAWLSSTLVKNVALVQCFIFTGTRKNMFLRGAVGKEETSFVAAEKKNVEESIIRAFCEGDCKPSALTRSEKSRVAMLCGKYSGDEWTYLR